MNSRSEKERAKQIQERCQRLLNEMLKDDDNKYCVDCDAKGPRWASWNLGIFLCIRCAGIHRKLGVHISRVKSVNLDTWTPQQVISLQQMGNSRARAVYEANLPDNFRRPQNEGNLENFIRAKYEHKKYIAREWEAPPLPKVNWDKELEEEEKQRRKKRESNQTNISSIRPLSTPLIIPQPLPKPKSSSPKPTRTSLQNTTDLLGLDTPTKEITGQKISSDSDIFTDFLNAAPNNSTSEMKSDSNNLSSSGASLSRTEEEENFFNQSVSAPNKQKQLTKDSILALYGNPIGNFGSPQSTAGAVPGMFNTSPMNSVANSFPKLQTTSQPVLQNDLLQAGMQIPNNAVSTVASLLFSSNPFYSMAASGVQTGIFSQKTFPNVPPANTVLNSFEFQSIQFTQQMEALNVSNSNNTNQFVFPQTNHFDADDAKSSQPTSFGQSVAATNVWQ